MMTDCFLLFGAGFCLPFSFYFLKFLFRGVSSTILDGQNVNID